MKVKIIHNQNEVFEFIKNRTRYNYIYQFNNLDEREWPNTICYGLYDGSTLREIAMVYTAYDIPVLIAACFEKGNYNKELISRIKGYLPPKFYTHIDKETLEAVFDKRDISEYYEYVNMGIDDYSKIESLDRKNTVTITYADFKRIEELFEESYPDSWLDDSLIKLTDNFGVEVDNKLVSFAGIHAYSTAQQVAAVAHVTTHPEYRNRGYGRDSIVALIKDLREKIKYIGLNVKVENLPAIKCYKNIGFEEYGRFVACEITNIKK
ncbi:GNAT family N-acetyltransferase [Wukongibacter baidiensis]|uniref:GNAT family N-acetyltransferase n=1 Tax=Wukongibacter baidiensis TaxID=1723361 RepID=UPI003D7FA949